MKLKLIAIVFAIQLRLPTQSFIKYNCFETYGNEVKYKFPIFPKNSSVFLITDFLEDKIDKQNKIKTVD